VILRQLADLVEARQGEVLRRGQLVIVQPVAEQRGGPLVRAAQEMADLLIERRF
jgi:hypothetical protein